MIAQAEQFTQLLEDYIKQRWPAFRIAYRQFNTDRNWGGKYFGQLAISVAIPQHLGPYKSYEIYDSNPAIGGFYSSDPGDVLKMRICHEVAHCCERWEYSQGRCRQDAHGPIWREHYAELRKRFLPLPDQDIQKKLYLENIREALQCEQRLSPE